MELSARFFNEAREEFDVRITVRVADFFRRQYGIALDRFEPDELSRRGLLLALAYEGTRHQARVVAAAAKGDPETYETFLDGLEGPSYMDAQIAAVNALINFTVRTLPKGRRELMGPKIAAAAEKIAMALRGDGLMSGDSAVSSESPIQAN